ncbi:PfkB family carbohydrate kinase [Shewanella surugensis]|uniref:PfkB family carbohydrate kinase n=2 Tax=Shewanella surugensis TaxID=212020 RepID=A0ABT0L9I7_9GAMM|nr:PfkB family carbohydrate kinase [Shewanella surugensis]
MTNGSEAVEIITPTFTSKVATPQISAIDTTGAGDSFVVGFWFALIGGRVDTENDMAVVDIQSLDLLSNDTQMRKAVAFAVRCGAKTCMQKDAFPALPLLDEVLSLC